MLLRLLALLPVCAILFGVNFFNQFAPTVFGLPLVLAWQIGCMLLTSLVMAIIYKLDPANQGSDQGSDQRSDQGSDQNPEQQP